MPIKSEFTLTHGEDALLTFAMTPPVAIGGWPVEFYALHRLGGDSRIFTKSMSSGFYNVSGMTIANSGQGIMSISVKSSDTSGIDPGVYVFASDRLSSGSVTRLADGYLIIEL